MAVERKSPIETRQMRSPLDPLCKVSPLPQVLSARPCCRVTLKNWIREVLFLLDVPDVETRRVALPHPLSCV